MRYLIIAAALVLSAPAFACDDVRAQNAIRDAARAQERQADTLRKMEQNQRDMNRRLEREMRNRR